VLKTALAAEMALC